MRNLHALNYYIRTDEINAVIWWFGRKNKVQVKYNNQGHIFIKGGSFGPKWRPLSIFTNYEIQSIMKHWEVNGKLILPHENEV